MKEISLNELPMYTDWVKKLLSLDEFEIRYKSKREIQREFEDEKWGPLLQDAKGIRDLSLAHVAKDIEELEKIIPCYISNKFCLGTGQEILDCHLDLYEETLKPFLEGASSLVELGAGYGSKILNLAQREKFSKLPLYAGEYTQSGCDLISLLAKSINKKVRVGHCDLKTLSIGDMDIPENAIIFTSYAVHYIPELSNVFCEFLCELKPQVVIHFEPCYEHYSLNSLHGLMCRRYVEINGYTRNIVSALEYGKKKEGISLKMQKNLIGNNPFLPISALTWVPPR